MVFVARCKTCSSFAFNLLHERVSKLQKDQRANKQMNTQTKPLLTTCGASVDWKCSSAPMTEICSSHLRLVSLPSSWYSPALLKRERSAARSCSASVHTAPVTAWQKITSRRSCSDVSGLGKRGKRKSKRGESGVSTSRRGVKSTQASTSHACPVASFH